ncbi:hypothetical protein KI387_030634, partial [Taxus chinensis]
VSSRLMMEISGEEENSSVPNALCPLAEACLRMDLTAVHRIMVAVHYDDDEAIGELSFKEWTLETQNMRNVRKHGDLAFEEKDFQTATQWYTR